VRALPLLQSGRDFDKLDGQAAVRKLACAPPATASAPSCRNLGGTVFANFQDGAIRGLDVARMIRSLTVGHAVGMAGTKEEPPTSPAFGLVPRRRVRRPPTISSSARWSR